MYTPPLYCLSQNDISRDLARLHPEFTIAMLSGKHVLLKNGLECHKILQFSKLFFDRRVSSYQLVTSIDKKHHSDARLFILLANVEYGSLLGC